MEDVIRANDRVLTALKAANPKALTKNVIQESTQLYWSKIGTVLDQLLDEGKIERIDTSAGVVYRLISNGNCK